jgi:hypothetical protein
MQAAVGDFAVRVGRKALVSVVNEPHPLNASWLRRDEFGQVVGTRDFEDVRPVLGGDQALTIFVNGICTQPEQALAAAEKIAEQEHAPVLSLYRGAHGTFGDTAEYARDFLGLGGSALVNTLAPVVTSIVGRDLPVLEIGHSHGAVLVSQSNLKVREQVRPAQLKWLWTETLGRAGSGFPKKQRESGPLLAHYINVNDAVPALLGQGEDPPDAVVIKFDGPIGPGSHRWETYLDHRRPFFEVRPDAFELLQRKRK